jgi:ABC-type nickel/cobalt efflux system permease component RcnA
MRHTCVERWDPRTALSKQGKTHFNILKCSKAFWDTYTALSSSVLLYSDCTCFRSNTILSIQSNHLPPPHTHTHTHARARAHAHTHTRDLKLSRLAVRFDFGLHFGAISRDGLHPVPKVSDTLSVSIVKHSSQIAYWTSSSFTLIFRNRFLFSRPRAEKWE